jgi:SAM-dependent methyltransferase
MGQVGSVTSPGLEWPSCNACGGARFKTVLAGCGDLLTGEPGRFDVQRCLGCGLVQTRPRPSDEELARYYPPEYTRIFLDSLSVPPARGLRGALGKVRRLPRGWREKYAFAAPAPHPGDAALEIGCGAGGQLAALEAAGWEAWGIEPSPAAAALAREALRAGDRRILEVPVEAAELPPGRFRLIVGQHVIEHLRDPSLGLRRARDWIAPGGTLVLQCPNFASWERHVFRRRWFGLDVPRHLYHFTPATLRRMLAETGWRTRSVRAQAYAPTLEGSLLLASDAVRGANRWSPGLHYAGALIGDLAHALGAKAYLEVVAEPSS